MSGPSSEALKTFIERYFPGKYEFYFPRKYEFSESPETLMVVEAGLNINSEIATPVELIAQKLLDDEEGDDFLKKIMTDSENANDIITVLSAITQMEKNEKAACLSLFVEYYYKHNDLKRLHEYIAFKDLSFETKLIYIGQLYDFYYTNRKGIITDGKSITIQWIEEFTEKELIAPLWENLNNDITSSFTENNTENKKLVCDFKNRSGHNLLILTAGCYADAVDGVINCAKDTPEKLDKLLTHQYASGRNALYMAVFRSAAAVKSILMAARSEQVRIDLLQATTSNNMNALMCAAGFNPSAVEPLLKAANSLQEPDRRTTLVDMLTTCTDSKANVLMYAMSPIFAITFQRDAVQELLNAVKWLPEPNNREVLITMLTTEDSDGWNSLMCAAAFLPDAVQHLLNAVKWLPEPNNREVLRTMLTTKNSDRRNAIALAKNWHPQVCKILEEAYKSLTHFQRAKPGFFNNTPSNDDRPTIDSFKPNG